MGYWVSEFLVLNVTLFKNRSYYSKSFKNLRSPKMKKFILITLCLCAFVVQSCRQSNPVDTEQYSISAITYKRDNIGFQDSVGVEKYVMYYELKNPQRTIHGFKSILPKDFENLAGSVSVSEFWKLNDYYESGLACGGFSIEILRSDNQRKRVYFAEAIPQVEKLQRKCDSLLDEMK